MIFPNERDRRIFNIHSDALDLISYQIQRRSYQSNSDSETFIRIIILISFYSKYSVNVHLEFF